MAGERQAEYSLNNMCLLGLQACSSVLVVAPDSLFGLVNGTLRMDHRWVGQLERGRQVLTQRHAAAGAAGGFQCARSGI